MLELVKKGGLNSKDLITFLYSTGYRLCSPLMAKVKYYSLRYKKLATEVASLFLLLP
jgi:hypothetical protein